MHGLTLGAGVGGHAAAGAGGPPHGTQFVGAGPLGYPAGMCVIGAGAGYASLPNIEAQVVVSPDDNILDPLVNILQRFGGPPPSGKKSTCWQKLSENT